MKYQIDVIQTPKGNFEIVGSGIPQDLAYNNPQGIKVQDQLMLPAKFRSITTRVFGSEDAAWQAIADHESWCAKCETFNCDTCHCCQCSED